jgi:hypothetical protein
MQNATSSGLSFPVPKAGLLAAKDYAHIRVIPCDCIRSPSILNSVPVAVCVVFTTAAAPCKTPPPWVFHFRCPKCAYQPQKSNGGFYPVYAHIRVIPCDCTRSRSILNSLPVAVCVVLILALELYQGVENVCKYQRSPLWGTEEVD